MVISSGWLTLIFTQPDSHLQLIERISVNACHQPSICPSDTDAMSNTYRPDEVVFILNIFSQ